MSAPTGKVHELRTLGDLLALDTDEFARLLPDLQAWHAVSRATAGLLGREVARETRWLMTWNDDGDPGTINAVNVRCGDTVFDLAAPETWPTQEGNQG